jgi:hypothetical protein
MKEASDCMTSAEDLYLHKTSVHEFCLHDLCAGFLPAWPLCKSYVYMTYVQEFCLHDICAGVLPAWQLYTSYVCMTYVQEFCLHDLCAGVLPAWPLCRSFVSMISVHFCLHDLSGIVTRHLYLESRTSRPRTLSVALLRGICTCRAWSLVLGLNLQHC